MFCRKSQPPPLLKFTSCYPTEWLDLKKENEGNDMVDCLTTARDCQEDEETSSWQEMPRQLETHSFPRPIDLPLTMELCYHVAHYSEITLI